MALSPANQGLRTFILRYLLVNTEYYNLLTQSLTTTYGKVSWTSQANAKRRCRSCRNPFSGLDRSSGETQAVYRLITRFAFRRHPVAIMGERGRGKELGARAMRAEGPRRGRPFVRVDCGALTPAMIESERFGIEGGLI